MDILAFKVGAILFTLPFHLCRKGGERVTNGIVKTLYMKERVGK